MFPQEFFGAGLLHKEEVELRRALNASLREVRRSHTKKEEKPNEFIATTTRCVWSTTNTEVSQEDDQSDEPLEMTKTVCIGTNTMFRIKSDRSKKSDDTNKGKGGSFKKQKTERGQKINKDSQQESELFKKPLKRKNGAEISFCSVKKKKKGIKGIESEPSFQNGSKMPSKSTAGEPTKSGVVGNTVRLNEEMGMSIDIVKKGFKSPTKTNKVCQHSGGQKPKMLVKDKAALYKPLHKRNMKGAQKSKIVQSLNAKFSATVGDETLLSAEVNNDGDIQRDDTSCSDKINKKSFSVQNDGEKLEQIMSGRSEVINSQDKNCEQRLQASNAGHGKLRRRLKHKLKDRKLVCPLGEIYIPANVAKTEDFLTFLCLRGKYLGSLLLIFLIIALKPMIKQIAKALSPN